MTDFERKEVALSAGKLTYYVAGEGRPLLYLHSAGGLHPAGPFAVSRPVEALAESFRVYLPVAPGFDGTAPLPGIESIPQIADLYAELLGQVAGEPADLVGTSFGGWCAMWLAVSHPALIDQLVLQAPYGLRPDGKGGVPSDPEARFKALHAHPEKLPPASGPPVHAAANGEMLQRYGGAAFDEALAARLGEVEALSLVLMGSRDTIVPPETGWLLRRALPNCFLVYIHDAAHALETDQPERVIKAVGKFLHRGPGFLVNWGDAA